MIHYQTTQSDYIKQFVDKITPILQAHLSREALPESLSRCPECPSSNRATWRCSECTWSRVLCCCCMRSAHRANPLHRIQRWNSNHFVDASLWKVGCFLVIPHQGSDICAIMQDRLNDFEVEEEHRDRLEQLQLEQTTDTAPKNDERCSGPPRQTDILPLPSGMNEENEDHILDEYIERVYAGMDEDQFEPNDNEPMQDEMTLPAPSIPQYLQGTVGSSNFDTYAPDSFSNFAQSTEPEWTNSYVRVLHTTGIHHIGMLSCTCQGVDLLPFDLVASNFVPSSFKKIRTLFTANLLDQSRLCNLEMKASAYQFYNYLRRITVPMDPGGVVNVLHEFRRMSRLWRWMKKLKWAGYGHNNKNPMLATNGELANFCPACPQDGKNIPWDWRNHAHKFLYRIQLAADGNFKADHVKAAHPGQDIWLVDGGGMARNRKDYMVFLKHHHNLPTVSTLCRVLCLIN